MVCAIRILRYSTLMAFTSLEQHYVPAGIYSCVPYIQVCNVPDLSCGLIFQLVVDTVRIHGISHDLTVTDQLQS